MNFDENETAIQLKLFDNPVRFDRDPKISEKSLIFKLEHLDTISSDKWSPINVTVSELIPDHSRFVASSGVDLKKSPMVIFFVNTTRPETTVRNIQNIKFCS